MSQYYFPIFLVFLLELFRLSQCKILTFIRILYLTYNIQSV